MLGRGKSSLLNCYAIKIYTVTVWLQKLFQPGHQMEVNNHRHASGKETLVSIGYEGGWMPEPTRK
jgi:hypothetical protein